MLPESLRPDLAAKKAPPPWDAKAQAVRQSLLRKIMRISKRAAGSVVKIRRQPDILYPAK